MTSPIDSPLTVEGMSTRCAICGILNEADEVYPARLGQVTLNDNPFTARRVTDHNPHGSR